MKRVTALFNPETHRRLKLHAMYNEMTLIQIIDHAVIAYLNANEQKDR